MPTVSIDLVGAAAGELADLRDGVRARPATACVAPSSRASSSFSGMTSMATIVAGARDDGAEHSGREPDPAEPEDRDAVAGLDRGRR